MNNEALIEEFIEVETSEKRNTVVSYRHILKKLGEGLGKDFTSALPKDVKLYAKKISGEYAQSSLDKHIIVIKAFFGFMLENDYITKDIKSVIKMAKSTKESIEIEGKKDFLTQREVALLMESIKHSKPEPKQKRVDFTRARDLCILGLAFKLGLRESEIRETKMEDFIEKENKNYIVVDGSRRKNGDSLILPLDQEMVSLLKNYMIERRSVGFTSEYLFLTINGKKLHNSDMNRMLKKRAEQSGICSPEQIHAHVCRHSASMILQSNGMSLGGVARVLGQRGTTVTYKSYTHLQEEALIENGVSFK